MTTDWYNLAHTMLPMLLLVVGGVLVMLADLFWPSGGASRWENGSPDRTPLLLFGMLACIVAMVAACHLWQSAETPSDISMWVLDRYSLVGGIVFLGATLGALAMGWGYLSDRQLPVGEYTYLLLFAGSGAWCMMASHNLLLIFLGLEILSISAYVLAGLNCTLRSSIEAGLKYFLLGAVGSSFLLFGIAFLYGAMGSFNLAEFTASGSLPPASQIYLILGIGFFLSGIGFKVALVPFHAWTPDVYEGAPIPVTAWFATGVKTAAFLLFARVLLPLLPLIPQVASTLIAGLAIATMFVGNLAALWQDNVKRMLAYSSIAHAGYAALALVVMATNPEAGVANLIWYLAAYSLMTLGAFAVLELMGRHGEEMTSLGNLAGLGERHPWLAASLSLFLLSLAGIPPTIGFMAKYYLFSSVVAAGHVPLTIAAVISSLISVAYYVRPIVIMYFRPVVAQEPRPIVGMSVPIRLAIILAVVGVLVAGLYPDPLLAVVQKSVLP